MKKITKKINKKPKRRPLKRKATTTQFKPDRIAFFLTVPVGMNWQKLTTEGSFTGDFTQAFVQAKKMVEDAFAAMNPNHGIVHKVAINADGDFEPIIVSPLKLRRYAIMEAQINACETIEQLAEYKANVPGDLMSCYINKKIELERKLQS